MLHALSTQHHGRFAPDFAFFSISQDPISNTLFISDSSFLDTSIGRTIGLIEHENETDQLFLFCHTFDRKMIEFYENKIRPYPYSPPASSSGSKKKLDNPSSPKLPPTMDNGGLSDSTNPVTDGRKLGDGYSGIIPASRQNISQGIALNLEKYLVGFESFRDDVIQMFWQTLYGRLERFEDIDVYPDRRSASHLADARVCGDIPQGIFRYVSILGISVMVQHPDNIRQPDAQEECPYKTILQKHNFSGVNSNSLQIQDKPLAIWYGRSSPKYSYHKGLEAPVYHSSGAAIQGFQYSVYLDKQLIKREFDAAALTRPFKTLSWAFILATILILVKILHILQKRILLFHIIAIFLEQEVIIKGNGKFCFILALWLLASSHLRQAYTGRMYSFLTTETKPTVARNLRILVNEQSDLYDLYISPSQFDLLKELIMEDIQDIKTSPEKEGVFKYLSNFMRQVNLMSTYELNLIHRNFSGAVGHASTAENFRKMYSRYAIISETNPTKTLRRYCGPTAWYGQEDLREDQPEPPIPYETVLQSSGNFLRFRNDDYRSIQAGIWAFQGYRDFFADYFCRDLEALIHSGIYAKWESLMTYYNEKDHFQKLGEEFGPIYKAPPKLSGGARLMTFEKVDNASLKVVWGSFSCCVINLCCGISQGSNKAFISTSITISNVESNIYV